MYAQYPKKTQHPCIKVGEQESTTWAAEAGSSQCEYPGVGVSATVYQGQKNHTKHCSGGSGSPNKSDYPGNKYDTFASEKVKK